MFIVNIFFSLFFSSNEIDDRMSFYLLMSPHLLLSLSFFAEVSENVSSAEGEDSTLCIWKPFAYGLNKYQALRLIHIRPFPPHMWLRKTYFFSPKITWWHAELSHKALPVFLVINWNIKEQPREAHQLINGGDFECRNSKQMQKRERKVDENSRLDWWLPPSLNPIFTTKKMYDS